MIGSAEQQPAARREHPPCLRQPARSVGDVLDRLPRPHHVAARILDRPRPVDIDQAQIVQSGVSLAGAAQGLGGDVQAHNPRSPLQQLASEPSLATADVEHTLARGDLAQEKAQAQLAVRRPQPGGHGLP